MNPSSEKNQHYTVTAISVLTGVAILLAVYFFASTLRWIIIPTVILYVLILAGRTLMVEKGIRRKRF